MADIAAYKSIIENGEYGEDVRDAIVGALKIMEKDGINFEKLNGMPGSYYCTKAEFTKMLVEGKYKGKELFDNKAIPNGQKPIRSSAVYESMDYIYKRLNVVMEGEAWPSGSES